MLIASGRVPRRIRVSVNRVTFTTRIHFYGPFGNLATPSRHIIFTCFSNVFYRTLSFLQPFVNFFFFSSAVLAGPRQIIGGSLCCSCTPYRSPEGVFTTPSGEKPSIESRSRPVPGGSISRPMILYITH